MKKVLSILLIFLFIPISFIFSACSTVEDVAGTYKLVEIYTKQGVIKVGETYNDVELKEDAAILVLNLDDNYTATYKDVNFEQSISGTWNKKENMILFSSSKLQTIELEFEIKKDKDLLLIIDGEAVFLLKKQAE